MRHGRIQCMVKRWKESILPEPSTDRALTSARPPVSKLTSSTAEESLSLEITTSAICSWVPREYLLQYNENIRIKINIHREEYGLTPSTPAEYHELLDCNEGTSHSQKSQILLDQKIRYSTPSYMRREYVVQKVWQHLFPFLLRSWWIRMSWGSLRRGMLLLWWISLWWSRILHKTRRVWMLCSWIG